MGGCCCCSSKGTELNNTPAYYYYPRASEEHVPLSSHHGAASAFSAGLLVDTNLETSIPDTYRPPPAPLPFDVARGHPLTLPGLQEVHGHKSDATGEAISSDSLRRTFGGNTQESSDKCEDLKKSDYNEETNPELDLKKQPEVELSKSVEPFVPEMEEDCPICLEEYNEENPKNISQCEHHFHLACILEWMERSDTCPVCEQEMIINSAVD